MLLFVCRMMALEVQINTILDTCKKTSTLESFPLLTKALRAPSYLFKAAFMIWKLIKAGIKMVSAIQSVKALGTQKLGQVRFRKDIMTETLETDLLLLHHGVVPNFQITRLLGCE